MMTHHQPNERDIIRQCDYGFSEEVKKKMSRMELPTLIFEDFTETTFGGSVKGGGNFGKLANWAIGEMEKGQIMCASCQKSKTIIIIYLLLQW